MSHLKETQLRVKAQKPIDLRHGEAGLFKIWVTEFYVRLTTHEGRLGACRQRWVGSTEQILTTDAHKQEIIQHT
jgi:hypothetical protein